MTTATPAKKRPVRKRSAAAAAPAPAAAPAKKAPARKVPAKKAPAAEAATRSSKRQSSSEGQVAPRKRVATKTPSQDAPETSTRGREKNVHGFVPGTDSAIIVDALLAGGGDRKDVNEKATAAVKKASGLATREGGEKNIPSLVSGVLRRLVDAGYEVESSFRVVPPQHVQDVMKEEEKQRARADALAARRAARAASKASK